MTVLTVLGILVAIGIAMFIIKDTNESSYRRFKKSFYTMENFISSVFGYGLVYFGDQSLHAAIANNGDKLNGQLLMAIGSIFLLSVVIIAIKNTSFLFGILNSILMMTIYLIATPFAILAVILAMAYFSDTKPVYTINN